MIGLLSGYIVVALLMTGDLLYSIYKGEYLQSTVTLATILVLFWTLIILMCIV
jgi:hypothetical protein